MHIYKNCLSQLNPKPGIIFQTKTAQSHQEISCVCQQAKIQQVLLMSIREVLIMLLRAGTCLLHIQTSVGQALACMSSSCCAGRASGARMICIPKAQCSGSGSRQQYKGLGDSYPERSLRGLQASSFSYLAKIYKMFYSQTSRKL